VRSNPAISLNRLASGILILVMTVFSVSCGSDDTSKANAPPESPTSGRIKISVDESFKPVIDSQIQVFESQNKDAKIEVEYKPEAECLKDLYNDSIRMVIVARGLTEEEEASMRQKLSFKPPFGPLALDAIAVIVNNKSKDTVFSMQEIRSMVKGTSGFPYKVLLDGTKATSTVRYVIDSLSGGAPLYNNVVAAKNTQGVIDYVSQNTDAIGLLGVSWVGNRDDPQALTFLEKVKIAAIECRGCNGTYVKPYQANIYYRRYPMLRPLYFILKENYRGLGSGFRNFLIYEKGQLVFQRAYLLPVRMRLEVREIDISE
jgi:phosphate transport system substrate-binding protein